MQHKCAQHKWDHIIVLFLRNYETNVLDRKKKNTRDEKHISSNQQRKKREKKRFFTLSSQC